MSDSRDKLVDLTKALVTTSRDVVAEEKDAASDDNPFDQVSGTPSLDALKINDEALTDEQLKELLEKIEEAKSDPETWKAVTNVLGLALKGLVLFLSLLMMVGCASTPQEVRDAMAIERKAFHVFKSDHDIIVVAYHADLKAALIKQVDLILKYELEAAGGDQAKRARLIEQSAKKRDEIQQMLDGHLSRIKQASNNFDIAMKIHIAVEDYLSQKFDSAAMAETAETGYDALEAVLAATSGD
ncbi:MAG: hypothetical protein ACYTBS_23465 [Planctomycetota bacterium]